jgi:hypothetical protein
MRRTGDDLAQVVVGQQRRELQHRRRDDHLDVERQLLDQMMRHVDGRLQRLRQCRADASQLVLRQQLQSLDGQFTRFAGFVFGQVRQQARHLCGQTMTHFLGLIIGQQQMRLRRGRLVVGDGTAYLFCLVDSEIIEDFRLRIRAGGELQPFGCIGRGSQRFRLVVIDPAHACPSLPDPESGSSAI